MYELVTKQFTKMLNNMNAILEKATHTAETKKFDMTYLINARLAPDQFNFIRQVQIMCDTAKKGAAQLAGKEAPVHQDTENSVAELKARISSVATYLEKFSEGDFAEAKTRKIINPRWDGQHLTGEEFLLQHVIPNFYFHMTTAYAILRHNGIDVGKKDYLGAMPLKK